MFCTMPYLDDYDIRRLTNPWLPLFIRFTTKNMKD